MRATLLVRSRKETIATVTTNMRQYYTTVPQTDGMLVLVRMSNGYNKHKAILQTHKQIHKQVILVLVQDEGDTTREI